MNHKFKKIKKIPKYLFTSGDNQLKQLDIKQQKLMKIYGRRHSDELRSITATNDG